MFLVLLPTLIVTLSVSHPGVSVVLWSLCWCLERYPDHCGSPGAAHSSLPLAIFYEGLRVEVPLLRTELGTFLDSSFSSLCPVVTTDSTDHGQAMEIFVLCVLLSHKWVGHTGLLLSAFLLQIIDPTGEDTLATCSSPLESPMALTVSRRGSVAWVLKRLPKYSI